MSAAPALALVGLQRAFGPFGLGPLSLELKGGEYWVLLGPSGCGKSMLLQTVCGFHRPDAGQVWLAGRDATSAPPEARGIGLVFQQAALFPHRSVRDNVAWGLDARKVPAPERERRVDEVVAALGLSPLLDRPVAALSGGEAQRVAIARAVAPRPALLLLDEPLSLLDHNTRLELQAQLGRWHKELGLTTLHVTHSREEARALGTHCALMLGGTLVQAGPAAEVFARPRCPFAASFLGLPAEAAVAQPECAKDCLARPSRCVAPQVSGDGAAGLEARAPRVKAPET
jgi:iron(III) transport system ATP-binding protein